MRLFQHRQNPKSSNSPAAWRGTSLPSSQQEFPFDKKGSIVQNCCGLRRTDISEFHRKEKEMATAAASSVLWSPAARSEEGSKRGRGKNKRFWTYEEDNVLLKCLHELSRDPKWKSESGLKNGYMNKLVEMIKVVLPTCGLKADPHIDSRIKQLFDEWVKNHKRAKGLYGAPFPHYDILAEIYAKDKATGDVSESFLGASNGMDVELSNEPLMIESDEEDDADSATRSKKRPRKKEFNYRYVLKKTKLKDLKGKGKVSDVDELVSSSIQSVSTNFEKMNANLGTMACAWSKAEEREQKLDEKGNTKSPLLCCLLQIPDEILMDEILPMLPVKSLSRFKCVSKSWLSHIESDGFMKIQYQNSAKNPRIMFNLNFYTLKECSLRSLLNLKGVSDPTKKEAVSGTLIGCCNGVMCSYNHQDARFSLWNPAIRVRIELPYSGGFYITKCGFGWDESTGAYKVFVVLCEYSRIKGTAKIYNSNTNSWRRIPRGCLSVYPADGVFLRGNLHWVERRHPQIECFDLEREEFGRIGLPLENDPKVPFCPPLLGLIGKSLSILIDLKERLEVWVMKEYGVKESWFKLVMFPPHIAPGIMSSPPFVGEGFNGDIFMVHHCLYRQGPNGEILAWDVENLMVYSPKDDAFSTASSYIDFNKANLYVESLVSPKRIIDAMPPPPLGEEEEEEEEEVAFVVEVAGGEE